MHIAYKKGKTGVACEKVGFGTKKVGFGAKKVGFSALNQIFGAREVMQLASCSSTSATALIKKMVALELVEKLPAPAMESIVFPLSPEKYSPQKKSKR